MLLVYLLGQVPLALQVAQAVQANQRDLGLLEDLQHLALLEALQDLLVLVVHIQLHPSRDMLQFTVVNGE